MFCPNCGQENDDTNKFCKGCGINLSADEKASAEVSSPNDVNQNTAESQTNEQVNLNNPDRVFTDSKYTQIGGFVAYLAYSAIVVAAIVAVLFGVAGISTYSGTSMLNSFMEPLTKPLGYIDKYENLENKFDPNYTDEMHDKYQAQSITSALSDFTDLMKYVSLVLILFAIAQAFLGWMFSLNLRHRKPIFTRYYYIVSAIWIVFYIMVFAFAIYYMSVFNGYSEQLKTMFVGSQVNSTGTSFLITSLVFIALKVLEVVIFTMYISKSVRLRTFMGTDAYLRANPFTKKVKSPQPVGNPITVNFDERHGLVTTSEIHVEKGEPISYTICPFCSKKVPSKTQFCGYCGKQIKF